MTYANVPELPPPRRPTPPLQESPVPEHTTIPDAAIPGIKYQQGTLEQVNPASVMNMRALFDSEYVAAAAAKQHLWIATMGYKIVPPLVDGMIFDVSMLRMTTFNCFICEEPYRTPLLGQRCAGEPQPTGRHSA